MASCTLFSPNRVRPAFTASAILATSTFFVTGMSVTSVSDLPERRAAAAIRSVTSSSLPRKEDNHQHLAAGYVFFIAEYYSSAGFQGFNKTLSPSRMPDTAARDPTTPCRITGRNTYLPARYMYTPV